MTEAEFQLAYFIIIGVLALAAIATPFVTPPYKVKPAPDGGTEV